MQLLKHFKELTVKPKNAKELKGLILQLAIQGKLTGKWRKENQNIKSASALLKEIKKERTKLIKEKKVRKGKPIQLIKKEEKYFEIPQNWVWTRLIEAGNIFNGNSVNKSIKAAKYEGLEEGLPYLGTKDINYGFEALNYENGVKIPFNEPKFKIAHKNTALICSEGGSAGKKCGITTEDICFGNKLYALEQYGDIESVYILSIYKTPVFFDVFQSKMTGIIGGVSINSFGEIPIPLPPLQEQKEIVDVVETLFKEVEQLEQLTVARINLKEDFVTSALHQLTTNNANQEWTFLQDHFKSFFNETSNIKKLRETVLQLAVQGKLTSEWRTSHPELVSGSHHASQLLKRIQEEKAQFIADKKIRKEKALPAITKDEIPYELPEGWVWEYLGTSMLKITDGTHHSPANVENGDFKYVSAKNIKSKGVKLSNITYVTEEAHKEIFARCNPELGDLLYIKDGATTGICCINDLDEEFSMLSSVALIKQPKEVLNEYLLRVFRSPYYYDLMRKGMTGVAITRVTLTKLKASIIPIPPLEEQKAIVEKVNALMGLCDALEQEVQQSQEHSVQLMQSCLREVFEGESKTVEV